MGSFNIKSGGAWRTTKSIHVKSGGTWRTAKEVWVRSGGVWRQAWTSFSATLNKSSATASATTTGTTVNASTTITVTVSGGTAPVTYLWEVVTSTGDTPPTVVSATAATVTIRITSNADLLAAGTIRCRLTDAASKVTYSPTITFNLRITSFA